MKNLELKVSCDEATFAAIRSVAVGLGDPRVVTQRDTYFHAPLGRLKLRQIDSDSGNAAELIGYQRPDDESARFSVYHRAAIDPAEAESLILALQTTLGIRTIVAKSREVVLYRHTRIHLDRIDTLGTYVELETVMADGDSNTQAAAELAEVVSLLGLAHLPVIGGSYSDMIEAAGA